MVFKRPSNGRDERNNRSSNRSSKSDNNSKRSASPSRGSSPKSSDRPSSDNSKKRYSDKPAASRSSFSSGDEKKSYGPRKPYSGRPTDSDERPKRNSDRGEKKDFVPRKKPYSGRSADSDETPSREGAPRDKKPYPSKKPLGQASFADRPKRNFEGGPSKDRKFAGSDSRPKRDFKKPEDERPFRKREKPNDKTASYRDNPVKTLRPKKAKKEDDNLIRLNRYIANAGICSRRKADELIIAGVVAVNGKVVNELGFKVDPLKDEIRYNGEMLKREKMVYVLLNKPKDYITTTDDPQERRTVMHLVEKASRERIYPIGRLDRNTTGLLLMTNDGDLADKLSHPRGNIVKLYQVELNKTLVQGDLNKIQFGLELEDGLIKPDAVSYVQGGSKREIGIQIHSGKNRIVRRIFEHLGYEVVKLDRVVYANLTKKDLPRGRWRYLDEQEIIQLKHLIK
jgi:23S rRNA pseudouridine2605 synthase